MFTCPTAIIEEGVVLGNGTHVWHFSHIMEGAKLGVSCNIGDNVFIGRKVIIGDNVKIANGAVIPEGVVIKDYVFIGSNVSFKNVKYPRAYRKANEYTPTIVEENATIDANACIMPGITIGRDSTVGAGAVVVHNVPQSSFVVGPSADCICNREECPICSKRKQKNILRHKKYAEKNKA
ncbi:MAG: acyltransferase [Candidatus Hodarchaeota archaeon]